jgi:hypothetical protein
LFSIYLDSQQSEKEMFDTVVHELLHVVCAMATFKPRLSGALEESRVRQAAKSVVNILTGQDKR